MQCKSISSRLHMKFDRVFAFVCDSDALSFFGRAIAFKDLVRIGAWQVD